MTDPGKIDFDPRKGRLVFKGDCRDALSVCQGMCCRIFSHIALTPAEYGSGLYRAKVFCSADGTPCSGERQGCVNRQYLLEKKTDDEHACVHQAPDNTCLIYDVRPQVCRDFSCKRGWQLSSVCPPTPAEIEPKREEAKGETGFPLPENALLALNPFFTIKTIFYAKEKKKLSLVMTQLNKCTFSTRTVDLDCDAADEDLLRRLIPLFDGKTSIGAVHAKLEKKCCTPVSRETIDTIAEQLFRSGLLVYGKAS
ncbi:MAG TPA: hypothetical protein P5287_04980 [bacterium]|nr:hypothetical protein [bacterium]